ncbi:MAG: amidohydrolase family protein [Acidimicrobiia bacterium]
MSSKYLIRGGCVLTLGARTPNFERADVLIEGDTISEVGTGLRSRDAEVVDATDTIVMPGFVDGHRHLWRSLFRNQGELDPEGAGRAEKAGYGRHYRPDDVYAAVLIGLLGAVESGITTVVDWSDIAPEPGHVEAALQARADVGVRTVYIYSTPGWVGGRIDHSSLLREIQVKAESAGMPMTLAAGLDDPTPSTIDQVTADWDSARRSGLRVHAHAGWDETTAGVIAELGRRDLLGDDVTLIHCSHLTEGDLDAIKSSQTGVVLTPSSEMAYGAGAPPLQGLIDRSIRPGLGVDDERMAPGDIFAPMRAAISLQHATLFDLKLAGKAGVPQLLTTREVIRYATSDGARVVGLDGVTGSLEAGKQADVLVLRADRPNISPVNDPIGAVVWGMDTSNIDWVFGAGRPLMREGALQGDLARARDLATDAQRRVAQAAGMLVGTGDSQ